MSARPHSEGHYWAKQTASCDLSYEESITGSWEVVQTYDNGGEGFNLRVFVPGCAHSEPVDNFVWGPRVIAPKGCQA